MRTNDEKSVANAKRSAKDRREIELADLKELLKQPEFRRYLWRHMNVTCGIMRSASSANGSIQSTNLGMQDVGRALWSEIEEVDALAIPLMMTEHFQSLKPPAAEPEVEES